MLAFNLSQILLKFVACQLFEQADLQRISSKTSFGHESAKTKTSFDRMQLVSLVRFFFACCGGFYKQALFTSIDSWGAFASFVVTNGISKAMTFIFGMLPWFAYSHDVLAPPVATATASGLDVALTKRRVRMVTGEGLQDNDGGDDNRSIDAEEEEQVLFATKVAKPEVKAGLAGLLRFCPGGCNADALNQRGQTCFTTFLNATAVQMAGVTHCVFILCLTAWPQPSAATFPTYNYLVVEGKTGQQLIFVLSMLLVEGTAYHLTDMLSAWRYHLTPTHVGLCHLQQYPHYCVSMLVIAWHVVTDVYLGLLLASAAGLFDLATPHGGVSAGSATNGL